MSDPPVDEVLIEKLYGGLNVKGWVMTVQGHPVYIVHIGPPGTGLISNKIYDKWNKTNGAESLTSLLRINYGSYTAQVMGKGTKFRSFIDDMTELVKPQQIMNDWQEIRKLNQMAKGSEEARQVWKRCIAQCNAIEKQDKSDGNRKIIAVQYIRDSFDPMLADLKRKFRLTEDETIQAFEDAVELLKVKQVMKS